MLLVEREHVVKQLNDLVLELANRKKIFTVISGSTAMGKSTVLRALNEQALSSGITVLSATSPPGENSSPYATLGKLLSTESGFTLPMPTAGVDTESEWIQVARQAHRVVAELARHGAVLITVDDVENTDVQSLRCLQYLHLTHDSASGPLGMAFTWEPRPGYTPPPILQELVYRPDVHHIRLNPLTRQGVAQLISECSGRSEPEEVTDSYYTLSGGNPLLIKAMLREEPVRDLSSRQEAPSPREETALDKHATAMSAFQQAILVCAHRMGPLATRVAGTIALLDGGADLHLLSLLNNINTGMAKQVVRAMTEAGLLKGIQFRHRAAQSALLREIPQHEQADLQYRAARLLHDQGAPSQSVAQLLLRTGPLQGQEWLISVLEDAARRALDENKAGLALQYLKLASECCSDENRRFSLKVRTANTQWLLLDSVSATACLRSLKAPVLAGKMHADEGLQVAEGMLWHLQLDDAVEVIDHVMSSAGDAMTECETRMRTLRSDVATCYPGVLPRIKADVSMDPSAKSVDPAICSSAVRAAQTLSAVLTRTANEHTMAQAEQVLQDESLAHGSLQAIAPALLSLIYADLLDSAAVWCDLYTTEAEAFDIPLSQELFGTFSSLVALRRGYLDVAADEAERALSRRADSWSLYTALTVATLAEAHTGIGQHHAAAEHFARPVPPEVFQTVPGLHYMFARGQHHLASDRPHAALADFSACGGRMTKWDIDSPSLAQWRIGAAEAWLRLGERQRAAKLVDEQLARTADGFPRARGAALRCLASIQTVKERPATLYKALQSFQVSGDRYGSARTLADLSEACQTLGDKAKARTAARRARRIAESCSARELTQALMPTSLATAKPQSANGSPEEHDSFAKLSDSERRVAILAAQGYTNRDVAAKLFVTVSTVEQHLTRVYSKLSIRNREELPTQFRIDSPTAS
ncbi:LuxR C-terminal-related transcriptional regulator [Streptomyces sp. NPDC048484]|uniref:helix-turn-helix transcriptional regulator n=1 Tax=Streptomyces sp. NPDC048484 TaxID=3155146 RepID=UPI00343604B4